MPHLCSQAAVARRLTAFSRHCASLLQLPRFVQGVLPLALAIPPAQPIANTSPLPQPRRNQQRVLLKLLRASMIMALLGLSISQVRAAPVDEYWRTDGTTGGTWTSTFWNIGSATATGGTGWTAANNAVFSANSTLTFASSTVGNVSVTNGSTVNITAGGTLTLSPLISTFDIGTGSTLTWQGQTVVASSASGITKNGAGTLDLGALTFTTTMNGGFTLNNGTVIVSGDKALGNGALALNGGTLQSSGTRAFATTSLVIGGNFALAGTGNANWDAATTIALGASTRTITNSTTSGSRQFRGLISGSAGAGLTFAGSGSAQIYVGNTGNTFSGAVTITGGEVVFNDNGSLGTGTSIVLDGGRLTMASMATSGSTSALTAATIASTHAMTIGDTAGTAISVQGATGVTSYDGVISNIAGKTGSWSKQGAGLLKLGGISTYTGGTAINNGTVQLTTGNNRLPTGTVVSLGQASSTNLGVLDLNGFNQIIAGLISTTGTNATASKNTVTSATSATLTINTGASSYVYGAGTAANSGILTGALSVTKVGSGTQTLGDSNTYTGATNIQEGTLALSSGNDRLPTGTTVTLGSGSTSGVLKLDGNNQTVAGLATSGTGTGNAVVNGNATASMFTVNNSTSQTYSGKLGGSGTNENNFTVIQQGSGSTTLSGANTYSGGTLISSGTVVADNNSALGAGAVAMTGGNLRASSGVTVSNDITIKNSSTVAADSFENTLTLFSGSGGGNSFLTGSSTSGARPATSPFAVDGTYALGVTGSTYTITSSAINTYGYSNVSLSLKLAAFSATSGNGLDATDTVTLQVSTDGGLTFFSQAIVGGLANATWAYDATGTVLRAYTASNASTTAPAAGGARTTDGYSTINITGLPTINNLVIKITALNDNAGETWALDNFKVNGTAAGGVTLGGDNTSDTATYSGTVTLNDNVTLTAASGGTVQMTGKLTGAASYGVTKSGAGTVVLANNTNDYAGTTSVSAGTLQVGVSSTGETGTGTTTVNGASAVLAGTGIVQGSTSVILGAIKPGDSGGAGTGTLNTHDLNFVPVAAATVAELQITGSAAGATLASDLINISGTLTLNNFSNILVNGSGYTAAVGDTFALLDWSGVLVTNGFSTGTNLRTGANSDGNEGNLDLPDITGLGLWQISSMLDAGALTLTVIAVPEPTRGILLLCGLLGMIWRRRR
ncbi:MAG: hypothetical protein B7Z37_26980 [Verrucomicrobia bacterium 12-59-8]|nr:MAG: hypothetical protein B7Z37_26980 [Verrucomicrobia bacterium 12-59-8]